jgi:hypothetical protein
MKHLKMYKHSKYFLPDNLIVGEEKVQTYLPIGHIAESERGNKQYFNLGPTCNFPKY